MYNTVTNTNTYTVLDIRKTFEGCEADIRTIARRTSKWSMDYVDDLFHDIIELAEKEYLNSVDIVLIDSNTEEVIKASKFKINSNGTASSSERAGKNNDWSNIPNTRLSVILSYTKKWNDLSESQQNEFQNNNDFKISWTSTSIDNSFPHLESNKKQLYASKGYELQKTIYN